jgi:hypothetical protein
MLAFVPVLLALLPGGGDARIEELLGRVTFRQPETRDPAELEVYERLSRAQLWREAIQLIEAKIGRFPDDLAIEVDFEYEGEELGKASGRGTRGSIKFNIKRLGLHLKRQQESEARRLELEKEGKTLYYKVPPVQIDRVLHHELVHVRQQSYAAPLWFIEGMAVIVAGDSNQLYSFLHSGKPVVALEHVAPPGLEVYARGMLFWKWLQHQGWADKVIRRTMIEREEWQKALKEVSGFEWPVLQELERAWSTSEADRLRSRPAR